MVAISTIGFHRAIADCIHDLYEANLFKEFECMEKEVIQTRGLISIVDICLQPELDKSYFGFSLSSTNENERNNAIQNIAYKTKIAIQNKCPEIILWPGYIKGYKAEDHSQFHKNKESLTKIKEEHTQNATPYIEQLCRSLFTICKQFPEINYSIPSPRTFYELPLYPHELEWILEDVKCPNLKYWHNTSSAHDLENLGFSSQEEWLEKHGENMSGVHIEDIANRETLLPPGTGEVNFKILRNYVPEEAIKVLRISEEFGIPGIKVALDNIKSWML